MSDLGLSMIDDTVNETNNWLNTLGQDLGLNHQHAYHTLRAGLHTVRDRLTVDEASALGAQLPHLVRGIYYENWRPADTPVTTRSTSQYCEELGAHLVDAHDPDPEAAARAIFRLLKGKLGSGIMQKIRESLPKDVAEDLYDTA
ncbi:Uncharacterized conserved protein, DUF2267 family [Palleronia marisminoris]|uniref:DUF2267 domain-containing protein n=1 Tax=Palleronia marisminoris TaxID=315423 RepID=A0A1Y5T4N7_9RHOB|nr:DUF2267 domain-containing protein [Palleronia marisminoris]SFH15927.1 Uncharacterized conserved protein, DUF2267 family [Palleronia marisminoris]SLN55152.1 hypothetical protein PAM7066_02627 [Palleronia marisminoris]